MGENSKIAWCDHTFNPWIGCARVSAECTNCYAETMDARWKWGGETHWGKTAPRLRTSAANWRKPIKWNSEAKAGERRRVFCASLADVFEDRPELEPWREDLGELIRVTRNLDWLLLTKRPENIIRLADDATLFICECAHSQGMWRPGAECQHCWAHRVGILPTNVWLGTTVGHQDTIGRAEELLDVDARVRFLSCEPLLGPLDLRSVLDGIDWVIVGGESGPNARRMHPDWVRSIRDQCADAGVPFFFKQWGGQRPGGLALLDNVIHLEFPTPTNSNYPEGV